MIYMAQPHHSIFRTALCFLVILLIFVPVTSATAAVGDTTRISVDSNRLQGNSTSGYPNMSSNGRYVVFDSEASNLVNGDVNGMVDIFLHDIQGSTTTLIPVNSNGAYLVGYPDISTDGRYIVYTSISKNLGANDFWGIFLYDRQTGTTAPISINSNGTQANEGSFNPAISANGRYVVFSSRASNLVSGDTNGGQDIFLRDTQNSITTRVSVSSSGSQAINNDPFFSITDSRSPSISDDGSFIVFQSNATNLVSQDTNVAYDIFLRDTNNGITSRLSVDSTGAQGNGGAWNPSISSNGRFAVFSSGSTNLVTGDTNGVEDVFLRNIENSSTSRVSINSNGLQGNSDSDSPSVSDDGKFITFFSNADNLVNGDINGGYDIFLHNMNNKETTLISIASNGTHGNGPSLSWQRPVPMSNDGQYIAYLSYASNLVDGDTNGVSDVFIYENDITQQTAQTADTKTRSLPDTGFAPNKASILPAQPASKFYKDEGIWLVIPSLGIKQSILGVPKNNGQWDITWLGNNIGWLHGTTFPTWSGNSVLTGHVYNSNGEAGPFANLGSITWDDEIIVNGWGQQYIYKVRSVSKWVSPQNTNILTKHEELPWLTLITCRDYDEKINSYHYRIIVRAVLVEIK